MAPPYLSTLISLLPQCTPVILIQWLLPEDTKSLPQIFINDTPPPTSIFLRSDLTSTKNVWLAHVRP